MVLSSRLSWQEQKLGSTHCQLQKDYLGKRTRTYNLESPPPEGGDRSGMLRKSKPGRGTSLGQFIPRAPRGHLVRRHGQAGSEAKLPPATPATCKVHD